MFNTRGLARLLLFERLSEDNGEDGRNKFAEHFVANREGRHYCGRKRAEDLKNEPGVETVLKLSDYDHGIRSYRIPYFSGWDARCIMKYVRDMVRPFEF